MAIKKEVEIGVNTKKGKKNVDELNESTKKTAQTMADLEDAADKFTGGFITGLKKGAAALKGIGAGIIDGIRGIRKFRLSSIATFKSIKVGIASTGIGLLVLAIGSLVTYFTQTQKGADKLKQAFSGIGATISVLVDRLSTFGGGLLKIFSGDISEGVNILKGAFSGLTDEIRDESAAAVQLAKDMQDLEDQEISMIEVRAKRLADIEALKLVAADETKSTKERTQALKEAIDLEKQLADEEIALAEERARIISEQNALGESTREDMQEEAEANARVIELNAQRDSRLKELIATYNSLNKQLNENTEETDDNAEAQAKLNEEIKKRDEVLEAEQAKLQESLSAEYDAILEAQNDAQTNELNAVEDKYNTLIEKAAEYGFDEIELNRLKNEEIAKVNKKYDDEDSARKKKKAEDDKAVQEATLGAIAGALGSLSNLAGKDAKAGKALSAAQAVINTYLGATKALGQGGIAGPIAAAGVVASGLASIRQIYATPIPSTSGGSGGGSVPRPQISTPSISPRFALDTAASDLGNQITQSLQGQPVRAYVVNQDIQNANKLDRKIKETATLE